MSVPQLEKFDFQKIKNRFNKLTYQKNQVKQQKVYKIKCKQCKAEYIGKTERILDIRVKEHQKNTLSNVKKHELDNPGHHMDYESVEVIDNASNDFKLRMKELHILKSEPELNKQLNSQSNFEIKTLIINAYPHYRN